MKLTLALLLITSPAAGETFAERWPSPVTVDPAPVSAPEPPGDESQRDCRCQDEHDGFRRQPAPRGGDGPALVRGARPDFVGTRCLPWRSCEGRPAGASHVIDAEQWFG